MLDRKVIGELLRIMEPGDVLWEAPDLFAYSYDASPTPLRPGYRPDVVVKARSTRQVAQVLQVADRHRLPVVARGLGSGRSGGSVPVAGGIVLALDGMNRILEWDEENLTVTVEPGVRTGDLADQCVQRGLFYPPDPSSAAHSTIGGNIAENAGGARAVKYGVTRDYVMGLEVVLAGGQVLRTGGKAVKNVTGYDLTRLFVGSEGTLGVVTRAVLRLIPLPKARRTVQVLFSSLDGACAAVARSIRSGTVPAAAELMDDVSIRAVAGSRRLETDPAVEAAVIFEFDGEGEDAVERQIAHARSICQACGSVRFLVAATGEEAAELWALRRGLSSAVAALAPDRIAEDISVPRAAFPEMVRRLKAIAAGHGLVVAVFGHAGDGNLHPSLLADLRLPGQRARVDGAVAEIFRTALELGGTLSGEHGIGITKKDYMAAALGEAGMAVHRNLKAALDPKGILNPGKIF